MLKIPTLASTVLSHAFKTTSVSVEVAIEAASQTSYASECLNWTIPHKCTASWSIRQLLVITLKQIAALEQFWADWGGHCTYWRYQDEWSSPQGVILNKYARAWDSFFARIGAHQCGALNRYVEMAGGPYMHTLIHHYSSSNSCVVSTKQTERLQSTEWWSVFG